MGIEKTAIKLATLNTIGNELDDSLEAARKELGQIEGRILAAKQIGDLIEALTKAVERDVDEGKIPIDEPLMIAAYVKEYILKARGLARDEGVRATHARFESQGRIVAWQEAVKKVKKLHDVQREKLEKLDRELTARAEGVEEVNPRLPWKEQQALREKEHHTDIMIAPKEPPKPKTRGKTRKRKKVTGAVQN